jgi:hypothetical protein
MEGMEAFSKESAVRKGNCQPKHSAVWDPDNGSWHYELSAKVISCKWSNNGG